MEISNQMLNRPAITKPACPKNCPPGVPDMMADDSSNPANNQRDDDAIGHLFDVLPLVIELIDVDPQHGPAACRLLQQGQQTAWDFAAVLDESIAPQSQLFRRKFLHQRRKRKTFLQIVLRDRNQVQFRGNFQKNAFEYRQRLREDREIARQWRCYAV